MKIKKKAKFGALCANFKFCLNNYDFSKKN